MSKELRLHAEHYLESSIHTASPAKMRLMLIERGVEVAATLARVWRESVADPANVAAGQTNVNEHSIKLLELLNELLSGVTGKDAPVGRQVSDLYVFLCQQLLRAEPRCDADAIDEIRLVLEIEAETWRLVCAQSTPGVTMSSSPVVQGGMDLCG